MEIKTTLEKVNERLQELRNEGANVSDSKVFIKGILAEYDFIDGILTVDILGKPWFVSQDYVEDEIENYFN